jgi:tripartite ATP-independent transporter DctM subunit
MDTGFATLLLLGTFFVTIFMGFNIAYALGLASIATALYLGVPLLTVVQIIVSKLGNFTLLAVPFFIIAGELMGIGGISDRLIRLSKSIVGWMRGGLAQVNIVASMFFGGISGSAAADTASLGAILIPMMEKDGYEKEFATNITMTSSVQGILIPPSHNMVIYAVSAGGVSIAKLFMGGIIPGLLLGVCLMIYSYYIARRHNYQKGSPFRIKVVLKELKESVWALGTVLIVVFGVLSGIFTATESAAIAALYAFFVAYFVYKDAPISSFGKVLSNTIKTLSTILILTSCATAFSFFITYLQIPQQLTHVLLSVSHNKYVLLLLINLLLLVLGTFMNMISIILIMTPILLPIVSSFGMDPVHFGVILILNLGIGLLTPPVGNVLFVGSSVSGIPIERLGRTLIPQLLVMIVVLLMITFIPAISMTIPNMLYS